ncbi:Smr/MutS family protein [Neptunomonas antarctica]|uniref:DNA-nicking endonuclease, Smr domain n=1 Tax=Neptunomonas antarctica TaxID=619304 RepID=A0A1N7K9G0_9GAMM|nr:Smr/MutS family protein [Neptunomonas antarctica]SIS58213.1 DNA-nicking endonuclease, Smr domain [Neptunomonas antarctica]
MSDKINSGTACPEISFIEIMSDVSPIKHDKVVLRTNGPLRKDKQRAYHRSMAEAEIEQVIDGLSSEVVAIVESDEELIFAAPGIQLRMMKRLRKGHVPWEAGIDLHGMSIDSARNELSLFIRDAQRQSMRSVIVIHGKAFSQSGQQPIIKSYVNDWLRQLPNVLAFCSAQPKDGGSGALYVLLKQTKQ